ncbi:MAG: transglutaminase-like domain-containing protein [Gammaproteobacteria bacterium]|nr:transglutaminase-like domain-containing protein [Gammaproteobacteria bacterium]
MHESTITSERDNQQKMRRIAMILFVVGLVLIAVHYMFLQTQQLNSDENWLITLDTTHIVKLPGSVISIQPPYESENIRLTGRSLNHTGLRVIPPLRNSLNKRALRLRANQPGTYQVSVEFSLQLGQTPHFHEGIVTLLDTKRRQHFLADNEWLQLEDPVFETKLTDIGLNEIEREKLPEKIFQFVHQFASYDQASFRTAPRVLVSRAGNHRERALLMVAMCRKAGIPARVITGIELKDDPSVSPDYWVEVFINDHWNIFHPGLGYRDSLPINYVALDKFGEGIVSAAIKGSPISSMNYVFTNDIMIEREPVSSSGPDNTRSEWYQVFMLDRLPADTREQLSLLMLLPLGALLCSLIRQLGGIHSYGVFTPTILALAVTYTETETTVLILVITLLLVYFGRPTFHQEMSRTPRLSIIFTLVATGMVIGVSILDYFSMATDGHLILLPIVIITSLIDRFFSAIETHGYHIAFVRLVWTFILTLAVLPVLLLDWLGGWILRYPEFHILTLALLILVSYYPFGKHKFPSWLRWLVEPEEKSAKKFARKSRVKRKKPTPS